MKEQKEKVTKRDFMAYQEVQFSGVTNMFDVEMVSRLSGLNRKQIIIIMKNYSSCARKWNFD